MKKAISKSKKDFGFEVKAVPDAVVGHKPHKNLFISAAVVVTALALIFTGFVPFAAQAASVSSTTISTPNDDQKCGIFDDTYGGGQTWLEGVTVEGVGNLQNGTINFPGVGDITLSNYSDTKFDWSSTFGVDAVFVKAGSSNGQNAVSQNLYVYAGQANDPEVTSDTNLVTFSHPSPPAISHISFCYDTNNPTIPDPKGSIKIVKNTVGADGTFDFTSNFGVTQLTTVGNTKDQTVNDLTPGSGYSISENTLPANWVLDSATCTNGTIAAITVVADATTTCTFTNSYDDPGTLNGELTLVKVVSGGTSVVADWTLSADGPSDISGKTTEPTVTDAVVSVGDYVLSETSTVTGYIASAWVCLNGQTPVAVTNATVTVNDGDDITCTITNTLRSDEDPIQTLTLVKVISGGNSVLADWTLSADGPTNITGVTGDAAITNASVSVGDYTLSESGTPSNYNASNWVCADGAQQPVTVTNNVVTVSSNDDITCTVTNTFRTSGGGGGGGGSSSGSRDDEPERPGQVLGETTTIPPQPQVLGATLPRTGLPVAGLVVLTLLAAAKVVHVGKKN